MSAPASTRPVPPVARKEPKRIEQLGRVRVDDYAWMTGRRSCATRR
jgi:oligopeptidase B